MIKVTVSYTDSEGGYSLAFKVLDDALQFIRSQQGIQEASYLIEEF